MLAINAISLKFHIHSHNRLIYSQIQPIFIKILKLNFHILAISLLSISYKAQKPNNFSVKISNKRKIGSNFAV